MKQGKLGILGGMGPQATLTFYQRILNMTQAQRDQEHIPTLILSDTPMPDRTEALRSGHTQPVHDRLLADARLLENWGASAIGVPCNTSHAFLEEIQKEIETPIVNMITETAACLAAQGVKKVGLLCTDGTANMGLYHRACQALGIDVVTPEPEIQSLVMDIIYKEIKAGQRGDENKFAAIDAHIRSKGCEKAILACTELSVYGEWHQLSDFYLDAMDVLARRCVELCGYPVKHS